MLNIILPRDLESLFEELSKDPDIILDLAVMLNCLGSCRLCERRFVPLAPLVETLSQIYNEPARLHEELRYNRYISLSNSLCGFCHANPGFLNMFQKMKQL
ncbi:hypothetical protein SAMN05660653_01669 [Desulfonatronum thiosulfatophilum]|uniref:Uncharacterized protein n=1 Tax=Desulfonatronum thiosulfatophilum TaxID=617002 RepID=A0A1G6CSF8_9BACT|nr:hypothetical protein [Desulfonatronum thiosulfatophilum]SDB35675.1 hypothetical protein SAMN05660653_01669 [Desulfonatronum thiosulfatophilum]